MIRTKLRALFHRFGQKDVPVINTPEASGKTITIPVGTKEFKIMNPGSYSPHLNIISRTEAFDLIKQEAGEGKLFLDVGGRNGERRDLAMGYVYKVIDLEPGTEDGIRGDICHCPEIPDDTFDVVFSMNLLEHVADPWAAAAEMTRIVRPGGLLIQLAPFAWRYHPFPEDFWRFSHTGLKLLFERTGLVSTLLSGYDIEMRRKDHRGGTLPDFLDVPPVDQLGGWREHWHAIWAGRKVEQNEARAMVHIDKEIE